MEAYTFRMMLPDTHKDRVRPFWHAVVLQNDGVCIVRLYMSMIHRDMINTLKIELSSTHTHYLQHDIDYSSLVLTS